MYHEEDEAFYITIGRSRSNKLIFLDIGARSLLTPATLAEHCCGRIG